ncbi:Cytochrome p450 [Globisporangium polare]
MLILPPAPTSLLAQLLTAALTVALTSVLARICSYIWRSKRADTLLASVPGPKGTFLLGSIPDVLRNLHRVYDHQAELLAKYGGRMRVPWSIFSGNVLFLSDPKDIEHMFSTNMDNYIKSDHFVKSVGEIFEKTLFALNHSHTADGGAMYRLQRKTITRVFTTTNFREFTEGVFHKYALRVVDIINAQNGKCEMHKIASQFTLQTIFDIGLGIPLESVDKDLGLKFIDAMDTVFLGIAARLMYKPYFKYFWWCMPSEYRFQRASKVLLDLIDGIISDRLQESEEQFAARSDILTMCIQKGRELAAEGNPMVDIPTLRSSITGMLFGGRDTISSLILYCFYNLAQYPEQQEKILQELKTLDTSALTYDDVKKLKYLDAFVWETLRLYPTAPLNTRQTAEDDILPDGTFVPAGTDIIVSSYYMGRNNAALWGDDQLVFRPERWLEMKTRPSAYEFPVFQAGPRICPGMNMAILETKTFIAILLQKFHVKIQDGEQVKDRPSVLALAMMMKDGLPLHLTPRSAACAS